MAIDGTNLTEVYDFQRNGYGVWVDISVSGDKIIWCDGYGEIFIANKDGSDSVITSYSIHYTKLYDGYKILQQLHSEAGIRITSYNVCYTKLLRIRRRIKLSPDRLH